MPGTTAGGQKAAQTIKDKFGPDHFAKIGKAGGMNKRARRVNQDNGDKR